MRIEKGENVSDPFPVHVPSQSDPIAQNPQMIIYTYIKMLCDSVLHLCFNFGKIERWNENINKKKEQKKRVVRGKDDKP